VLSVVADLTEMAGDLFLSLSGNIVLGCFFLCLSTEMAGDGVSVCNLLRPLLSPSSRFLSKFSYIRHVGHIEPGIRLDNGLLSVLSWSA
jgi:hypothetical protein